MKCASSGCAEGARKRKGRLCGRPFLKNLAFSGLERLNVLCLPALGSLDDIELHGLAFLEAAEAVGLDGREVHEHILATLPGDKAIAFCVIEPLHCTLFHCVAFPLLD